MSRYILTPPPNDAARFKEPFYGCWAVALASLINVTELGSASYADVVTGFTAYMITDGSIPVPDGTADAGVGISGGMDAVCTLYNVLCTMIYGSTFTHDYLLNVLQKKEHALIMYSDGYDLGHV